MTSSPEWLRHQAEVHPDRLALVTPTGRWTFRELDAGVARLAGILADLGIDAGDRIAYHLRAEAEQVLLVHALTRLGAVLVPLNTRLKDEELAPIIHNADPSWLISEHGNLPAMGGARQRALAEILKRTPSDLRPGGVLNFSDLHALVYTSGTTGRSKGVELTVGNQWWSAVGFALNGGLSDEDRWLHVMPLFHVGGLTILFRSVIHGSAVVLEPRFEAARAYDMMRQEEVTLVSVVPTMVHRLLELGRPAPASLRLMLLGGAPASPELVERARDNGYPVVPTFGMTETCSQVVTLDVDAGDDHGAASGHPNLPTEIRITKDGHAVPANDLGEIWVKSPSVARGYWRNLEATQETFVNGWLRTGDIGKLDQRGYLVVTDRLKDLIIRGGENISPREVEDQLGRMPGIDDAAVFGLPDPEWGQRVAAAIVSRQNLSPDDLTKFLSNRLASYKIPSVYFRLTEIPRNASGKILRTKLVREAETMPRWVGNP